MSALGWFVLGLLATVALVAAVALVVGAAMLSSELSRRLRDDD